MNIIDKYHTDPAFKQLVDLMESFIWKHEYTPSEMREAALIASINYENKRPDKLYFINPELEDALRKTNKLFEDFDKSNGN